jgi:hypothetical protein
MFSFALRRSRPELARGIQIGATLLMLLSWFAFLLVRWGSLCF